MFQFNAWMNVNHIPYSTANKIIKELFEAYDRGVDYTKQKIKKKLIEDKVSEDIIENILAVVDKVDPFLIAKQELSTARDRKRFIDQHFLNIVPETVPLSKKGNKVTESYQYIPIKKSLKVLLEDETYVKQRLADPYSFEDNVIKDVRDGDCFVQNEFFKANPDAVPLIVFVDELEIVNPLGAGKLKHKLNCCYYSTLEVQAPLRSKVQSIQLLALIKSEDWKKYGNSVFFKRFIDDMKDLESDGLSIDVPMSQIVKAGLVYIIGDNLGQHSISELNQCFSSGNICRWCLGSYKDICKDSMNFFDWREGVDVPEEWTEELYDASASKAEAGDDEDGTFGVKRHCTFNQLQSFHCVKQTPACIGHDFYEGVLSYDVQFCLEYLIKKEKLISQDDFNRKLKNALLSSRDCGNRPKPFRPGRKKFEGNANSLRILARLLVVLLAEYLDQSDVGNLLVKLEEVSEIISAPRLTLFEIDILEETVNDYLELRIKAIADINMPDIKPKHHYMFHYSKLFKFHGPLIQLWAMRMESKHQYLKNCTRAAKNFINTAKTCSTRHQLAQVSYRYNGLFPKMLHVPDNALTVRELKVLYRDNFISRFMSTLDDSAVLPPNVTIHGTSYETGMVLVLDKLFEGEFTVGVLRAIAVLESEVSFCCTAFNARKSKYGYYISEEKVADMTVRGYSSLADYYPLLRIGTMESFIFTLHHFVSQSV